MSEEIVQRTEAWRQIRLGKVTASRVADLMATTRSGFSASRSNYMAELICERLTGQAADKFSSPAMQWGTDNEAGAKAAYSFLTDAVIEEEGFALHSSITDFGASPDGLIGADGLIEIKCPNTATHLDTLLTETVEGKYITQMQSQMAVTGRQWCDFVSYDPRLPADMQLFIKRVKRDASHIAEIEKQITLFLGELSAKLADLETKYGARAA